MKPLKYPKTWHCKISKPHGNDRVLDTLEHFIGREVICTVKLDGENTGMTKTLCHARSLDSKDHISRHYVKQLHGKIAHLIPEEYEIFGENLQAKHSIKYTNLPTYFFVFGIYNEENVCLSWDETVQICKELGLRTVPVLYRGIWNEETVKNCYTGRTIIDGRDCGAMEGYVCRGTNAFHYNDFAQNLYKYVSPHFKPGNEHWTNLAYEANDLLKG